MEEKKDADIRISMVWILLAHRWKPYLFHLLSSKINRKVPTMSVTPVSTTNLDVVSNLFNQGETNLESSLNSMIQQMGANPSQADLQALQVVMIKWQSVVSLQSNVMKSLGDTYKQIIANVGQ